MGTADDVVPELCRRTRLAGQQLALQHWLQEVLNSMWGHQPRPFSKGTKGTDTGKVHVHWGTCSGTETPPGRADAGSGRPHTGSQVEGSPQNSFALL